MITFVKPKSLNGTQLRDELNAGGVAISQDINAITVKGDDLIIDIAETDKTKAETIIAAHIGKDNPIEPTIENKLASVGLSVADLKTALGL